MLPQERSTHGLVFRSTRSKNDFRKRWLAMHVSLSSTLTLINCRMCGWTRTFPCVSGQLGCYHKHMKSTKVDCFSSIPFSPWPSHENVNSLGSTLLTKYMTSIYLSVQWSPFAFLPLLLICCCVEVMSSCLHVLPFCLFCSRQLFTWGALFLLRALISTNVVNR